MEKTKNWQVALLKVVFLLIVGMLLRDTVVMMYSSLYELVTNDWQAAASLSTLFALVAIIVNFLSGKKLEKKNSPVKQENKLNTPNNNNFHQNHR